MTRNSLANPPAQAETANPADDALVIALRSALESIVGTLRPVDPELKCYTPAEAAELLGKTENWVVEAIQDGRIPCTYIGKSPRLTATHIRQVQLQGERQPHRFARPLAA